MVKLVAPFHQVADDTNQIAPHRTANATIVHLKNFFISINHQLVIDTNLTKLIDDDGNFPSVFVGQDAVEQGRLACA